MNLAAADGHPAAVMTCPSPTRQQGAVGGVDREEAPRPGAHRLPGAPEIDAEVAKLKFQAMGVEIDELTAEQREDLASWEQGT